MDYGQGSEPILKPSSDKAEVGQGCGTISHQTVGRKQSVWFNQHEDCSFKIGSILYRLTLRRLSSFKIDLSIRRWVRPQTLTNIMTIWLRLRSIESVFYIQIKIIEYLWHRMTRLDSPFWVAASGRMIMASFGQSFPFLCGLPTDTYIFFSELRLQLVTGGAHCLHGRALNPSLW